jgi:alkylation response protein AidB-like acyl-CoA dehydrogenase
VAGGSSEGAEVERFRRELRHWLATQLTSEVIEAGRHPVEETNLDVLRAWNHTLADAGWAAPSWPLEWGGRDLDVDHQVAYLEEMSRARAPGPVNVIGVSNIAPAIMHVGTDEQKRRFLPPMLRGDEIWSQGMSEPDAGSDLASLRTSAVADGDDFVVNGQKTWNSLGHVADWCQLYVRTDPEAAKHHGISCLLVDLRSPGIEARPLRTITGDHSFAELFLTDVRIPRSALLGELNQGWAVARTTLSHERAGVARLHLMMATKLGDLLADERVRGALGDPVVRQRVAAVHSGITTMRWLTGRGLADPTEFGGAGASLAKLAWSVTDQELASLAVDLLGMDGLSGPWADNLSSARQASIAGGTTEINRSIIGEHVLGLPR